MTYLVKEGVFEKKIMFENGLINGLYVSMQPLTTTCNHPQPPKTTHSQA